MKVPANPHFTGAVTRPEYRQPRLTPRQRKRQQYALRAKPVELYSTTIVKALREARI